MAALEPASPLEPMFSRDAAAPLGPDASKRRVSPRALALGAVLLLHVALIGGLQHAWHRAEAHHEQRGSTVRMVTIQLRPLPEPPRTQRPATTRAQTAAARSSERRAIPAPQASPRDDAPSTRPSAQLPSPRPDVDRHEEAPRSTVVIATPSPAASSASGPTGRDLMYGAATQRAVRQGTQGQPLLAERADNASLAPDRIDASTRLGNEMMKGATGDCLKGQFAGAGAGLLSLPFWVLAEARGKCRR